MNTLTQFLGAASFGTLVYFYITNNIFRYYTKHAIFALSATLCASVYIPLMLWRPKNYKNALLPAWSLKMVGRFLGIRFSVSGKENIIENSACVVLINHQSIVDLLVLAELWPILGNCTVISKKEIFYMWPFGLACWLWGTIYIDRLSGEKAKLTINKTAKTIRSKQAKLCMFPEGTRHGGENLLPFKKGAFHVAVSCQCPLQPIVVSQYYFLDSKKHIFDKGIINVNILPKISTIGLKKEDVDSLIIDTYNTMNTQYKNITQKTLENIQHSIKKK
ncbi:hypothetical protein PGB90_002789 [Kerria lacca]